MDVIPCPLHEGSSGHCPQQNTWVLQLSRMPAPILLLHSSILWGFASPGNACPWVCSWAVGYRPTAVGRVSPTALPVAPSQGRLGCSGFGSKKMEDKRARKRKLLGAYCGHCRSGKGFERTDKACFHNVQIGTLTSAGQEMQVMAGTWLLPHIAAG